MVVDVVVIVVVKTTVGCYWIDRKKDDCCDKKYDCFHKKQLLFLVSF